FDAVLLGDLAQVSVPQRMRREGNVFALVAHGGVGLAGERAQQVIDILAREPAVGAGAEEGPLRSPRTRKDSSERGHPGMSWLPNSPATWRARAPLADR